MAKRAKGVEGVEKHAPVQSLARVGEGAPDASLRAQVLAHRARGLSVSGAARAAGTTGTSVRRWIKADAAFAEAMDDAEQEGKDFLEDQAFKLATVGVPKAVYQRGQVVGTEMVRDTHLLITLLAGRIDKYRQARSKIELTGPGGGPVQVQAVRERISDKLAALAGPDTPPGSDAPPGSSN